MLYGDYIRRKNKNTFKVAEGEGILPLVIQNSKGRHLKDYRIHGNSVQETISDDIFDKDNVNMLDKTYVDASTKKVTSHEQTKSIYLQVSPLTRYTVSKMATSRFSISTFTDIPAVGMVANNYTSNSAEGNGATSFSVTTGANDNYMVIFLYMTNYDAAIDFQDVVDSLCVTEHIPNVNTPSEVQSVGEKVNNIFDNSKLSATLVEGTGDIEVIGCGATFMNHTNTVAMLKPSTQYTISFDVEVTSVPDDTVWKLSPAGSANWLGVYIYSSASPNSGNVILVSNVTEPVKVGDTYRVYKVFTTTSELYNDARNFYILSYARTYVKIDGSSGYANGKALFKNFQIREGEYTQTEMREYEPYGKYKVPIISRGKNLISYPYEHSNRTVNGVTFSVNADKSINIQGTATATTFFRLMYGVRLMIKQDSVISVEGLDGNAELVADLNDNRSIYLTKNATSSKIPAGSVLKSVQLYAMGGHTVNATNVKVQLEEGSSATEYEEYKEPIATNIYLDEPLRKVGDYADYIDFKNRQVVRRVGVIEFNGVGEYTNGGYWGRFTSSISENACTYYCANSDHFGVYKNSTIVGGNLLSNYFTYQDIGASSSDTFIGKCFINPVSNPPYISCRVPFTSLDAWLTHLKELKANGNPVVMYYKMVTAKTEDVELPTIPSMKGTTVYEVNAAVKASNMYVKYVKS